MIALAFLPEAGYQSLGRDVDSPPVGGENNANAAPKGAVFCLFVT
jgi:hypothetical protein